MPTLNGVLAVFLLNSVLTSSPSDDTTLGAEPQTDAADKVVEDIPAPLPAVVLKVPAVMSIPSQCEANGGNCHKPHHCAMSVKKSATISDGAPFVDQVGDVISYLVTVTNSGATPVTISAISDSLVPLQGPALPRQLVPGESLTCSGNYVVQGADLQQPAIVNKVTVTSLECGCGTDVATVPVKCMTGPPAPPSFCVEKEACIADGAKSVDAVGDQVHYKVTVINSGGVPICLETIHDSMPSLALTGPSLPTEIPPAGRAEFTGTLTVESEHLCDAHLVNTVAATVRGLGSKSDDVVVKVHKSDCSKCECKECCVMLPVDKIIVCPKKYTIGKKYWEPDEKTVPYCDVQCDDQGRCVETLGTRTYRDFVLRTHCEPYLVKEGAYKVVCVMQEHCMKCGVRIDDCDESTVKHGRHAGRESEPHAAHSAVGPAHTLNRMMSTSVADFFAPSPRLPRLILLTSTNARQASSISRLAALQFPEDDPEAAAATAPLVPVPTGAARGLNALVSRPSPAITNCDRCNNVNCCKELYDETVVEEHPCPEPVCLKYWEEFEKTVPYCRISCDKVTVDGIENRKCTEIIGTRTVRTFVQRERVEELVLYKPKVVRDPQPQTRCLKCGLDVEDCKAKHTH